MTYAEQRELILSGVQFPGPDGQAHYRYAASIIKQSLELEGGVGLALTWLDRAMPFYRFLLTTEEADQFEAAVKLACANTRKDS